MKRTTVMLPDDLAALLDHERWRHDVPAAEIVREALLDDPNHERAIAILHQRGLQLVLPALGVAEVCRL